MKPGDLVMISGDTCPVYPDDISPGNWKTKSHIGYAVNGDVALFMYSEVVNNSSDLIFARILLPEKGPVWVRQVWLKVIDETR